MKRLKSYFTGAFLLFSLSCIILYTGLYRKFNISHLVWTIITIFQLIDFIAISLLLLYLNSGELIGHRNRYSFILYFRKNNKFLLNKILKLLHFSRTGMIKK